MGIGEVLQEQRKVLGLTITEAARLCGIPRAYLSMIEAGKRAPSPQTILQVMPALSVPTDAWLPAYLGEETRCQHLLRLAKIFYAEQQYDRARRVLGRAYFVSRNDHDGRYNTEIYHLLARVYYAMNLYPRALRWLRLLDRATRHFPDPDMQAVAAYNLGLTLAKLGQRVDAIKKLDEADESFVRLRKWFEVGVVALWKGNILLAMHAYPEAHQAYRRAVYFLRRKDYLGDARLGEAITTAMLQGHAAAVPLLRAAAEGASATPLIKAKAGVCLAASLRQLGRHHEALAALYRSTGVEEPWPDNLRASLLTEATLCHLFLGDRTSALKTYQEYRELKGTKDSQDTAAMHILAGVLGVSPLNDPIPVAIEDEYEQRLKAALQLLHSSGGSGPA